MDVIFIMRQIQEKMLEGNKKLFCAFIDLEKAYDGISREGGVLAFEEEGRAREVCQNRDGNVCGSQCYGQDNEWGHDILAFCTKSLSFCDGDGRAE